jgi:hypothetical protein
MKTQQEYDDTGVRNMFCAMIALACRDARSMRKKGIIGADWKPTHKRNCGNRKLAIGYYKEAAVQELCEFMHGDLDVLLTEAGCEFTSRDVMADIDADVRGERTNLHKEFVWLLEGEYQHG